MIQRPRGTRDFLPDELEGRRSVETGMRDAARLWGYREISTPAFEELELFTLRSGEGIVQEMYAFEDKGGRMMALRPELTAPVLRMFVNEARSLPKPIRWFYFADCFRYERPQKGRYRQFWQFGIELIGSDTPLAETEVVALASELLVATGIRFSLQVGHLGFVRSILAGMDDGAARRVRTFLDKKEHEALREYLEGLGRGDLWSCLDSLAGCRTPEEAFEVTGPIPEKPRIEEFFSILDQMDIRYTLNTSIARGLDYYTGMVFEGFAENLGAENQILGGGTYRLAHLFGGADTPSCGCAIGFDRVMVSLGDRKIAGPDGVNVLVMPGGQKLALAVARAMRIAGIPATMSLSERSLSTQLTNAAKTARYALIVGAREAGSGIVTLRDLATGDQQELSPHDAVSEVARHGTCR
jgi:histidyl-tRNA synthetase